MKMLVKIMFALIAVFAMVACDGETYKTVKIGSQTWMAENLKVETKDSWCYDNNELKCEEYGRLYTWGEAMKACPSGWHLPSKSEFETLFETVGSESKAGKMLKSKTGWRDHGNGTDAYSFSALPAGYRLNNGNFEGEGDDAYFWTSTGSSRKPSFMRLGYYSDNAVLEINREEYFGLSVRCVKD